MDSILCDRLGIEYPGSDVKVMPEASRLHWYGGDGVLKAYDHLVDKSYGVQSMKKEMKRAEAKAQLVLDRKAAKRGVEKKGNKQIVEKKGSKQVMEKKGKKRSAAVMTSTNTAAEDAAIRVYDSDDAPDLPPPSNQLAAVKKRPRTPSATHESPARKRGRQESPTSSCVDTNITSQSKVNKGKGRVLVEDSDAEMEDDDIVMNENEEEGEDGEEDEDEQEGDKEEKEEEGDIAGPSKSLSPLPSPSGSSHV